MTPPSPDAARNRFAWRKRIRSGLRITWALWAAIWLAGGIGAAVDDAATDTAGETAAFVAFFLVFALAPLLGHLWWSRHHPIVDPALIDAPRTTADRLRTKLAQVTDAANELRSRGWSTPDDHRAIRQRVERLEELVAADELSVQRGGQVSPVIEPEIDLLRDRVLGILDAAINSAAIAPGDAELDNRLQDQLDALHARQRAVDEVEGRPQAGY